MNITIDNDGFKLHPCNIKTSGCNQLERVHMFESCNIYGNFRNNNVVMIEINLEFNEHPQLQ